MMTTLEKVRRLEHYIAVDSSAVDPVLEIIIDKLLAREIARMRELKARLADQLATFEKRYALKSADFYARFENGELGDGMDCMEWSATVEMLVNAERRLALLEIAPDS
ncbi:hypothetical protein HYR99_16485 [Candidatus Poribacteria bacterium]|nr:hypothetical protein [Candidatus Poribacteria bacterium]